MAKLITGRAVGTPGKGAPSKSNKVSLTLAVFNAVQITDDSVSVRNAYGPMTGFKGDYLVSVQDDGEQYVIPGWMIGAPVG